VSQWYTVSLGVSLQSWSFETLVQNNKGCTNVYMYDIKMSFDVEYTSQTHAVCKALQDFKVTHLQIPLLTLV